jgi:hemoglobin-like flavoprotein
LRTFDAKQKTDRNTFMDLNQIQLIRQTFAQVVPIADTAAALFYKKLFELDPSLRPLFSSSLDEQGRKLMQMIGAAVGLLDKPKVLVPTLEGLGRRHVAYGVRTEHYDTVGVALILTLQQGLGAAFTTEARQAWVALYELIATTMKKGADTPAPRDPVLAAA